MVRGRDTSVIFVMNYLPKIFLSLKKPVEFINITQKRVQSKLGIFITHVLYFSRIFAIFFKPNNIRILTVMNFAARISVTE